MTPKKKNGCEIIEESITDGIKEIFDKADARIAKGLDRHTVNCHASLEVLLFMTRDHTRGHAGKLVPTQVNNEDEWFFLLEIHERLDLPPNVCALLVTPTTFENMPVMSAYQKRDAEITVGERNAYTIVVARCNDYSRIMQVSLPGPENAVIDIFKDGAHFAEYNYNSIRECIDELSSVIWTHFKPKKRWSRANVALYTENWYAKFIDGHKMTNVPFHEEYSYFHHPELLGLSPVESVFKMIESGIPLDFHSLETAMELVNELNDDFQIGTLPATAEGVLEGNLYDCQSLFNRLVVEIDVSWDQLEYLDTKELPTRSLKNKVYYDAFDKTARRLYEKISGTPCPDELVLV